MRKIDPAHTAIPLKHLLNVNGTTPTADVYGYDPADDDARTAAQGRMAASLLHGLRYPDGRVHQFIYED